MNKFNCRWLDQNGTFAIHDPQHTTGLYFPLAGESGMKSVVTATLGGDAKCSQNTFLLAPVSIGDLHTSKSTRNFWIKLQKDAWSVTGVSAEAEMLKGTELEETVTLKAGLMWHEVHRYSPKHKLSSTVTSFVPCDENPMEIMQITIKNEGLTPVTVTPISAIPLYCRSADNIRDHRHVTSLLHRATVMEYGLTVTPTLTFDERGHCENTKTYYVLGAELPGMAMTACCPSLADFVGEGGSLTRPEAVFGNPLVWKQPGQVCDGEEVIAALKFNPAVLAPGGERTYTLILGITEKETASNVMNSIIHKYFNADGALNALGTVKEYWTAKNNVRVETGDRDFDGFMQWVSFQPTLRRIFGCSFLPYHDYGKGGRGWRDLWQDCLALIIMEPDNVRQMLVDDYRGVRFDGTNATIIGEKDGEFLADRNGIPRVWMDHGFWPLLTTDYYIHFTGDDSILLENVTYFKDAHINRCEDLDDAWTLDQGTIQYDCDGNAVTGSVLEHILIENLTACFDVGDHGNIRLRNADWNDGLDMASEKGESIAFTAAYAWNLRKLAELIQHLAERNETLAFNREITILLDPHADSASQKRAALQSFHKGCIHETSGEKMLLSLSEIADRLNVISLAMEKQIRENEWIRTPEGSFFNGYYDEQGEQLEGIHGGRIRMTLTGQVFPIMSGMANAEEIRNIIASADSLLYDRNIGGYRLNTDFGDGNCKMGRAFGFAYGQKENGAVFSHMAVMFANALYRRGYTEAGFQTLESLYSQAANFDKCRQYPGLPEYFDNQGRGMYPYLTGSASWMLLTVITEIFGVKGRFGDILLSPQLIHEQLDNKGKISMQFCFNGSTVRIEYAAQTVKEKYTGVNNLTVDGRPVCGNRIARELIADGCFHIVTAQLT